jgi:hypothetical protein
VKLPVYLDNLALKGVAENYRQQGDHIIRQIRFIRESAIPLAMVGLLSALPGTQLWRRLRREGRLLAQSEVKLAATVYHFRKLNDLFG